MERPARLGQGSSHFLCVDPLRNYYRRAERMDMPALDVPDFWTADMVRALPEDGKRYETVHGELFVSATLRVWHQVVVDRLHTALKEYLKPHDLQMAMTGDADISWGPDVLVQPDIYVAPRAELRTLDWTHITSLSLVVEVISPSSQRTDRFPKRRLYQEVGVPTYWIVDADERYVEV